jgi:hypothetical protein
MRADASQPVSDGVNANQDAPNTPYGGGADGDLRAATTMTVTPATQPIRPRWWPGVGAWALWALAVLGLPVIAWLDHLSRRAGRPELAQLTNGGWLPELAALSAATVGAVLASRRPRHPVGWLLLVLALTVNASGVTAAYAAYGLLARTAALPAAAAVFRWFPVFTVATLPALSFVLLLTPTGSLPSPRWRWWAWVTVAAPVILLVALAVAGGPLDPRYQLAVGGPFDFRGLGGVLLVVNQLVLAVATGGVVVAAASLVVASAAPAAPSGSSFAGWRGQHCWWCWGACWSWAAWRWGPPPRSPGQPVASWRSCRSRSARRSCATGCTTWTASSAAPWPTGC